MSEEFFPAPHGAVLRGVLETAYNDGATVNDSDVLFAPEGAKFNSYKRTMIPRNGVAAFRAGFRPAAGQFMGEYNITAEIHHVTVVDNTTRPAHDTWFMGAGFQRSYDAASEYSGPNHAADGTNDKQLIYTHKPRHSTAESSSHIYWTEIAEGDAEGLLHDLKGARHGAKLKMVGGGIWVIECEGKSIGTKPVKVTTPSTNDTFPSSTESVAMAADIALTKFVTSAVTYGGGTEAIPTMTGTLWDFELDLGVSVKEIIRPSGTGGVARIVWEVTGPATCSYTIDQVVWDDDFDIYTFQDEGKALRLTIVQDDPQNADDLHELQLTMFIADLVPGEADGYRNMQVSCTSAYPDSGSDGGGLVPAASIIWKHVTLGTPP